MSPSPRNKGLISSGKLEGIINVNKNPVFLNMPAFPDFPVETNGPWRGCVFEYPERFLKNGPNQPTSININPLEHQGTTSCLALNWGFAALVVPAASATLAAGTSRLARRFVGTSGVLPLDEAVTGPGPVVCRVTTCGVSTTVRLPGWRSWGSNIGRCWTPKKHRVSCWWFRILAAHL